MYRRCTRFSKFISAWTAFKFFLKLFILVSFSLQFALRRHGNSTELADSRALPCHGRHSQTESKQRCQRPASSSPAAVALVSRIVPALAHQHRVCAGLPIARRIQTGPQRAILARQRPISASLPLWARTSPSAWRLPGPLTWLKPPSSRSEPRYPFCTSASCIHSGICAWPPPAGCSGCIA